MGKQNGKKKKHSSRKLLPAAVETSAIADLSTVPAAAIPRPGTAVSAIRPLTPGRTTQPSTAWITGALAYLPRTHSLGSLEFMDLSRYRPDQLVDILIDANPDASMAVWNNVLLVNSGLSFTVRNRDDTRDDAVGVRLLKEILQGINAGSGGYETLIDIFALCLYTKGAICAEAAPAAGLTQLEDIYPVDPLTVRFSWVNLGTAEEPIWRMVMLQQTPWVVGPKFLNPQQVFYLALHPRVDDPYGRAPIMAGIGAILFWLDVLRDLRRALHTNAWGRLDVSVIAEAVAQNAPDEIKDDPDKIGDWVEARLDEMKAELAHLEPDDSFVHWDSVTMKAVDASGKMADPHPLINAIEAMIIRGVKQLPTMMGGAQTRGAGQLGTLEYQIATLGVKTQQRLIEYLFERCLELALRLAGRQNRVHAHFEEVRTTDELKAQQALALKIQNFSRMRDQGYIDQDEAAQNVAGHEPVADPPAVSTINADRPSPPPMPSNQNNPLDGTEPNSSQPGVGDTTGEPGDQGGAPQPAPSRSVLDIEADIYDIVRRANDEGRLEQLVGAD